MKKARSHRFHRQAAGFLMWRERVYPPLWSFYASTTPTRAGVDFWFLTSASNRLVRY